MKIDKEIAHPVHAQHKLKLEYTEIPFKCDGCKEAGIGLKYKCQARTQQKTSCEFDLHKTCAVALSTITHPFYNKCEFEFKYEPPGPEKRICDACRNGVIGFVYHCKRCDFDLHPCCANLPQVLEDGEHRRLYLCMKLSSPCHQCGNRGLGWSYRSECKTYNLHVSCVKELLVERWQLMYLNKDKDKDNKDKYLRELQTRIPSLKGMAVPRNHNSTSGGKVMISKAAAAIRVIVSAILGDPTAVIAAVVGGLLPK